MYRLPIRRSKVEEIVELAQVTQDINNMETEGDSNLLNKMKAAHKGIPEHSAALFRAIDELTDDEKIALLLIFQRGKGVFSDEEINGETAQIYMNNPSFSATEVSNYIMEFNEIAEYLKYLVAFRKLNPYLVNLNLLSK